MTRQRNTAIKVILTMGVLAFVFLVLVSRGLERALTPDERERVADRSPQSDFKGAQAYDHVERLVGFGETENAAAARRDLRQYLSATLRRAGLSVREQRETVTTGEAEQEGVNVIGMIPGTRPGAIVLAAPYSVRREDGTVHVAANADAAGVACLLELGRVLGPDRRGRPLWLLCFEQRRGTAPSPPTGAKAFVEAYTGENEEVAGAVVVEGVGDCYLKVFRDKTAPEWMNDTVWDTARRLGYAGHFAPMARSAPASYEPFREAGLPVLALVDPVFAGTPVAHETTYGSPRDTLDKVCRGSLQAVGDVLYHAIPALEAGIDREQRRQGGR